ncbi:hypothetical protein NDU88_005478 [Pleurodeles waltl]|uniref:MATH domain-containing protein n=1 Tax=Pleurodeles waltl TaxID=8319 RepID=A0AAV7LU76_PLEWA|nr:hypothetical protein NDU88_005478 [Pleurodeles waltl]
MLSCLTVEKVMFKNEWTLRVLAENRDPECTSATHKYHAFVTLNHGWSIQTTLKKVGSSYFQISILEEEEEEQEEDEELGGERATIGFLRRLRKYPGCLQVAAPRPRRRALVLGSGAGGATAEESGSAASAPRSGVGPRRDRSPRAV